MNISLMPDPTFYPSPGMAMQAAPERIAYVTLLNVGKTGKRDAMGVINVDPRSHAMASSSARWIFPMTITNCITSAGTHAARASARRPRIRTWSAVTWLCRASRRPGFTSLIRNRTPISPRS